MAASDHSVTPLSENSSQWYQDVISKARLAEHGPAKGSMIILPYGYRMWELMQAQLDKRFRETGHENAYFPLFIPMSYIEKEAEHIEGFAPELAVVTHAGGKKLDEPLVVRPTSETIIGEMYAKWINSYRDLPIKMNQWANVVRWELRPRLFLRTTEFLWQEGHTAHVDEKDAMDETMLMLNVYEKFAREYAAIPVWTGEKTAKERFAGAVKTFTIEGAMRDGKALQSGTSHYLGTNFAKTFNIAYTDQENQKRLCHTTSWGVSTRMLGAVILAHGDDKGLILPPRLAPYQFVIVPVGPAKERDVIEKAAHALAEKLSGMNIENGEPIRVHVDTTDASAGYKFNFWEMAGAPLRIEIGPRDLAKGEVVIASRLTGEKTSLSTESFLQNAAKMLDQYHEDLLQRALSFRDQNTVEVDNWYDFKVQVSKGFALAHHCGHVECENEIKEATRATARCVPRTIEKESGHCILCKKTAGYDRRVLFSRAY